MRQALFAILLLAVASPASADDPKKASTLFVDGNKFYNVGEYTKALELFKDGYFAKPDPAFLFNMAQCYRMLGEPEPAIREYRAYLRSRPEAPNRAEVEGFIGDLEAEVKRRGLARPLPPAASPETAPPSSRQAPAVTPAPAPRAPVSAAAPAPKEPPTAAPPAETNAPAAAVESPAPAPTTPVYKKAWFWGVIAGAVVIAGGAIGLAVAETTPNNASPQGDYTVAIRF